MPSDGSIPTNTVLPHIFYKDVAKAVEWLTSTFGFIEHYRYGGLRQSAEHKCHWPHVS
jgi:uncharacterized glyoxalase superfamily protein PhnB